MASIDEAFAEFEKVANNPAAELDRHIAAGKTVIGVGPYYLPEELVYAAGAIPFGVWGRIGTASAVREYFPPFYCSICQMTLEMGLNHELDKLSGMMVSALCDTLRGLSQNFRVGVTTVPTIFVSQPQNRANEAGIAFATRSYKEAARNVGEACCAIIDDDALREAIKLYNAWRAEMRRFLKLAGERPALVSVARRSAVVNAGYYMNKAVHLEKVAALNDLLEEQPADTAGFKRVVLSGIYYDIPAIVDMLDENKFAVVADDVAKESRALSISVSEEGDPYEALARGFCAIENDSLLFDPEKGRIQHVVDIAKDSGAQGVVLLMAKFCDPEEFDQPLLIKACRDAGLPIVSVEIDQSTETYEQARTQLETFAELLEA